MHRRRGGVANARFALLAAQQRAHRREQECGVWAMAPHCAKSVCCCRVSRAIEKCVQIDAKWLRERWTLRNPTVNGVQEGGKACACTALHVLSFDVGNCAAVPTGLGAAICV